MFLWFPSFFTTESGQGRVSMHSYMSKKLDQEKEPDGWLKPYATHGGRVIIWQHSVQHPPHQTSNPTHLHPNLPPHPSIQVLATREGQSTSGTETKVTVISRKHLRDLRRQMVSLPSTPLHVITVIQPKRVAYWAPLWSMLFHLLLVDWRNLTGWHLLIPTFKYSYGVLFAKNL